MQVQIKFKRTGSNSVYGSFEAGDVLRCDSALAEHFVREGLARYTDQVALVVPDDAQVSPTKETKRRKHK